MAQMQLQFDLLKAQVAAQKTLAREAAIKAEVGRHRTPQIKVEFSFIILGSYFFYIENLH